MSRVCLVKAVPSGRILNFLRSGNRLTKPEGCPKSIYEKMQKCWEWDREARPELVELQVIMEIDHFFIPNLNPI